MIRSNDDGKHAHGKPTHAIAWGAGADTARSVWWFVLYSPDGRGQRAWRAWILWTLWLLEVAHCRHCRGVARGHIAPVRPEPLAALQRRTGSENGADFESALAALAPFFRQLGIDEPERPPSFLPSFDEQFRAVIDSAPAVVSFVYGVPSLDVVEQAHRAGIVVIGTATTVDEAVALERGGVDAVVGTGSEAAGHRVSFLLPAEESLVGTFALIPQIVDAIDIPVIAAGESRIAEGSLPRSR